LFLFKEILGAFVLNKQRASLDNKQLYYSYSAVKTKKPSGYPEGFFYTNLKGAY